MEFIGIRNSCIMILTFIFVFICTFQGTVEFSLNREENYPLDEQTDKNTIIDLITGLYSKTLESKGMQPEKRGQGWAISYGKRGSHGWSIAYGKRQNSNMDSFHRPNYVVTKRASPVASTSLITWNSTPNKRQQGWHIAYGKRFATPLYRR